MKRDQRPAPGASAADSASALESYRRKRGAATPEPFGGEGTRPRLFVVQLHAARSRHFDLRLEIGGVLKSWAVPKGPVADPEIRRLAVHTEDHPVEYGEFEGQIPEGNYGAGAMIVWDRGRWAALEDPVEGLEKGKLLFELFGYKLRGVWTLVRTSRSPKEWLLIKKPDGWAVEPDDPAPSDLSVLSGLAVEEIAAGADRGSRAAEALAEAGVPRREVRLEELRPMLAETRKKPFSRPGWLFEIKYDGYRLLAERRDGRIHLQLRSGRSANATFPDLARALASLPYEHFIVDGEVVILSPEGRPRFQLLQKRGQLSRAADVERAAVELPATYFVFDLLVFEGHDLRRLPLVERKAALAELFPDLGPLRYTDHVEERGEEAFEHARELGLEGLVGKDGSAPYRGGRSRAWLKLPAERRGDFVVVGFTRGKGSRASLGALHLGAWEAGELVYAGRAGTGFDDADLAALTAVLEELRIDRPAFGGEIPKGREHRWVEPRLVSEVRYRQRTDEGLLRFPVFLGLRPDKGVDDADRIGEAGGATTGSTESPPRLELTNLDKVFWPDEGLTKGDLIEYYRSVAAHLLPYLADRPVVLDRYPDGVAGKSFFQKNAPAYLPHWLRTERIRGDDEERHCFVADDVDSLLYLVNLGSIPLHVTASRVDSLERPDWCVLDLDPKGAPFEHVVTIAREAKRLCDAIGLPSRPKTSGGSGLHVLVPLGSDASQEQSRLLAELLARVLVSSLPDIATAARRLAERHEKVYIDYLQNGRGKLLVAPYSVRPFAGAPVSAPLRWREVTPRLDPSRFNLRTLPRRLARMKADPLRPVLGGEGADLHRALERLAERLG